MERLFEALRKETESEGDQLSAVFDFPGRVGLRARFHGMEEVIGYKQFRKSMI